MTRSDVRPDDDPSMYGSDVNKASDLLYETSAWLHDVLTGQADFQDLYDALIERLVPTADAALNEARALRARAVHAEARVRAVDALTTQAERGEGIIITPGFTTYYSVDTGLLRDALRQRA